MQHDVVPSQVFGCLIADVDPIRMNSILGVEVPSVCMLTLYGELCKCLDFFTKAKVYNLLYDRCKRCGNAMRDDHLTRLLSICVQQHISGKYDTSCMDKCFCYEY